MSKRIAYLVGVFPSLSERFLLREIVELSECGAEVTILSLERPSTAHWSAEAARFRNRIYYAPSPFSWTMMRAALGWMVRSPLRYLGVKVLMAGLCLRDPRLLRRAWRVLPTAEYFAAQMRRHHIEHIHAYFAALPALIGLLCAKLTGLPFSFSGHARDLFVRPKVLRQKVARAAFVVACTDYTQRYLQALAPECAERIHRIYHGLLRRELAHSLRAPADPPVILAVGRLVRKKGFITLIRACHRLRQMGVIFHCHIVGDGPERHQLEKQFRLYRDLLKDAVILDGALSPYQVDSLYRQASVFVCPSVIAPDGDRDGIPNVLLEALSWRLPVVASEVAGIPELVQHEQTGLLVPPGDAEALASAIRNLLEDKALARRLGDQGRERVLRDFDLQKNVRPLLRLFGV